MKKIILNEDNLTLADINKESTKVRAIIVNNNNEIILARYNGVYLMPGGSIDVGEDIDSAIIREIREETGIIVDDHCVKPFLLIEHYNKNHPKQEENNIVNKLLKTYYYIINTDQCINEKLIKLTEREIQHNFSVMFVNIKNIVPLIKNNSTNNPRNFFFKRELLTVLEEYQKELKAENTKKYSQLV